MPSLYYVFIRVCQLFPFEPTLHYLKVTTLSPCKLASLQTLIFPSLVAKGSWSYDQDIYTHMLKTIHQLGAGLWAPQEEQEY